MTALGTETVTHGSLRTQVGTLVVAVTETGLAHLTWADRPDAAADRLDLPVTRDPARTATVLDQLRAYFAGELRDFDLPLDWRLTTRVQQQVLTTLHETVRHGDVVTYGGLADRSGGTIPARAIGGVMGANPIPIVVPCHRVVAGDGLGGYSGGVGDGLEVKRWLLMFEGALPPTLDFDPAAGPA